jgi:hypothetical protein
VDADEQDERANVVCLDLWSAFTRRMEHICLDCCATWIAQYKLLGGFGGFFGDRKPLAYIRTRYGSIIRVRELLAAGATITARFEQEQAASRALPFVVPDQAGSSAPSAAIAFGESSVPLFPTRDYHATSGAPNDAAVTVSASIFAAASHAKSAPPTPTDAGAMGRGKTAGLPQETLALPVGGSSTEQPKVKKEEPPDFPDEKEAPVSTTPAPIGSFPPAPPVS